MSVGSELRRRLYERFNIGREVKIVLSQYLQLQGRLYPPQLSICIRKLHKTLVGDQLPRTSKV